MFGLAIGLPLIEDLDVNPIRILDAQTRAGVVLLARTVL
jgi:hypothetical protein